MDELLRQLLNQLDKVGELHEDIFDSECRERMSNAVFDGFVRQKPSFLVPPDFGLHSARANAAVRQALTDFIQSANVRATALGLLSFHQRLNAFQNGDIQSDQEGNYYDDYFGYSPPEEFDEAGNVIPIGARKAAMRERRH